MPADRSNCLSTLCLILICVTFTACSPTGPESSLEGRLAFLGGGSDGNFEILTGDADGSGVTRVIGGLPEFVDLAWSPDARSLLYATNFGGTIRFEIFTIDLSGANQKALSIDGRMPAWSPDGARIVFSSVNEASGHYDLFTMKPDGTDLQPLIESQQDKFAPVWSPDGSRIAFEARLGQSGIYVVNADGTDLRLVVGASSTAAVGAPAWSPDERRLAFNSTMHRAGERDPLGRYEIYVTDLEGSQVERLTFLSHERRAVRFPTWSPDGQAIAFESQTEVEGGVGFIYRIYVIGADGSDPREVPFGRGVRSPKWAPR